MANLGSRKVKQENNYFLQYMKFAGKLLHSTSSRLLCNIYYTKKSGVQCCLID